MPTQAPVQMTRAQYTAKYGAPPAAAAAAPQPLGGAPTAPVQMTRAQYQAKYGTAPGAPATPVAQAVPKTYSQTPLGAAQHVGDIVGDAFKGGIAQAKAGSSEAFATTDPIKKVEATLKFGSGVASAISSPLAPLMAPLDALVKRAAEGYASIPSVQKFATSNAGDVTARVAEDLSNAGNIAGTLAGIKGGAKPTIETAGGIADKAVSVLPKKSLPDAHPLVPKRYDELTKLENSSAPVRKAVAAAKDKGIDSKKLLAQSDLLHNSVDDTGTIRTADARQQLTDHIAPAERVVSDTLKREGVTLPLKSVEHALNSAVDKSGLEGAALEGAYSKVEGELKGLSRRADASGKISLSKVHDAKVNKYSTIDYTNEGAKKADKAIARTYKQLVENHTKSADVQALNRELQSHYSVLNLLEKLDGKKVEGGRLGKHVARILGGVIGSHFGPLGAIVGSEIAAKAKGAAMSKTLNGLGTGGLKQSVAMDQAIANSKQPPLMLKAPEPGAPNVKNNVAIPMRGPKPADETGVPKGDYAKTADQRNLANTTSSKTKITAASKPTAPKSENATQPITSSISKSVPPTAEAATEKSTALGKAKAILQTIKKEGQRGFIKNPLAAKGPKIHPDDQRVMADFTDYQAGSYKPGVAEAHRLELDAARLHEHYFPNEKMPKTTQGIANRFGRALEASGFGKGQSRGQDGRFQSHKGTSTKGGGLTK